jgi:hypothetical protein
MANMRTRERISWMTVLALVAFCAAAHAGSAPLQAVDDPAGRMPLNGTFPGGPHPVPAELVDEALNVPAVRTAVARMEAGGYRRTPDHDAARALDGRTMVTIAFADPANPDHAPIVIVARDLNGSTARTWVAGGVFLVDPQTGQVSLAGDVPETDHFVVRILQPGATGPVTLSGSRGGHRTVNDWLNCSLVGCGASLAGCVKLGGMLGAPPQAQAGCAIVGCGMLSFACLW